MTKGPTPEGAGGGRTRPGSHLPNLKQGLIQKAGSLGQKVFKMAAGENASVFSSCLCGGAWRASVEKTLREKTQVWILELKL